MSARRKALVIGGSFGGLFAANLLLRAGWDVAIFERAGVALASGGNGSHRKFRYPNFPGALILRGQSSDDAQHYQERDIRSAIYKISQ